SAIQLAFVSTIRPVVSSSPVDRITARSIIEPSTVCACPFRRCPRGAGSSLRPGKFRRPAETCIANPPMGKMKKLLGGARIDPKPVTATTSVTELVDGAFQAYNGARLREAVQLFTRRMLEDDVTIGVSVSGALTPAGLGMSCLIPLVEAGFIDWVIST